MGLVSLLLDVPKGISPSLLGEAHVLRSELLLWLGEGPDGVVFGEYFFVEAGGAEFEAVVGDGVDMDGDTPAIDDHFFLVEDVGVGRDEGGFVVVLAAEEVGEVFVDGILAGVATF